MSSHIGSEPASPTTRIGSIDQQERAKRGNSIVTFHGLATPLIVEYSTRREVRRDEQRFRAAYTCDIGSGGSGSKNRNIERLGRAVAVWALLTVHRSQGKEAAARSQPFLMFERGRRQHPALSRLGQAEAVYGPRSQGEEAAARSPTPRRGGEAGKGGSGMTLLTVYRCQGKRPPPVPSRMFVLQQATARIQSVSWV